MNFEAALKQALDPIQASQVKEAMLYSLLSGGKRLRPQLVFAFLEDCGEDPNQGLDAAIALEMVHTYSLIHDDLPAMDNDTLRRGKATCHIQYGEDVAILAGDGLLTYAFEYLGKSKIPNEEKSALMTLLASASGASGMIYGQELDLKSEALPVDVETLNRIHHNKTGKLFACALQMGAVCAKRPGLVPVLEKIGLEMGLAFQYQDDILGATLSPEQMGKSNSDQANQKATSVSVLGIERAQALLDETYEETIQDLRALNLPHQNLLTLINHMTKRTH